MIDHEKTRIILTTMASKRSLIKLNLVIPKLTGPSKTSRYSMTYDTVSYRSYNVLVH